MHYIAITGFSTEVEAAKVERKEEWEKRVVLVMDEMDVKEDLVHDKHSGTLFGSIEGANADSEAIAKTMFVFMVSGLLLEHFSVSLHITQLHPCPSNP